MVEGRGGKVGSLGFREHEDGLAPGGTRLEKHFTGGPFWKNEAVFRAFSVEFLFFSF